MERFQQLEIIDVLFPDVVDETSNLKKTLQAFKRAGAPGHDPLEY